MLIVKARATDFGASGDLFSFKGGVEFNIQMKEPHSSDSVLKDSTDPSSYEQYQGRKL